MAPWETVIGLECHVELDTQTKMFCGCRNVFGADPNTNTCPVCMGHPGSLPVPNAEAIRRIVKIGLALESAIAPHSLFHRKNYFYPDLPKNYQISQYDLPICVGGHLDIDLGAGSTKRVGITRVHMEEDTGKTTHGSESGRIHEAAYALMEGVAEAEAIDTIAKLGFAHPLGPLALADLIGLDTCVSIMEVLHRGLGDPKYAPCPLLRQYVQAGRLGRKSGHGFYSY